MCGIVGIISKNQAGLYHTDMDLFEDLLVCDSLRGLDSTGVFGVYKNRQARTLKVAAEPHMLFRCNEWSDFKTKAVSSMTMVVGHNRSATRGSVTTTNAHPFTEGKIVLVHNGTLHNQKDFNTDVEVDSHAITHALNKRPAKEVLKEIDGAFAFVWYDRSEGKLFIARNSERPLSFAETTNNIIFASEGPMLEWLLSRKTGAIKPTTESFPVGQLISFDAKGNKTEEEFELFRPKFHGYSHKTAYPTYYPTTLPPTQTGTMKTSQDISDTRIQSGTSVLIKVKEIIQSSVPNGLIKIKGTMISHQIGVDVTGHIAKDLTLQDAQLMCFLPYVQGTIAGYHSSVCGPSYFLNTIEHTETIYTYNTKLPLPIWKHVVNNCVCDKCGKSINQHQPEFTSVKQRGKSSNFRVVCPDCVCEALNEATEINIKDCNNIISERKPLSKAPESWPFPENQQECSLH